MLKITHSAGFFSCSSVALHQIMENHNVTNLWQKFSNGINRSEQYADYKTNGEDLIPFFFNENKLLWIGAKNRKIVNNLWDAQQTVYVKEEFEDTLPFVKKYFEPSDFVKDLKDQFIQDYNLDLNNLCTVHYRGLDRKPNAPTATYDDFFDKMVEVQDENPNIKFLILTDETEFKNDALLYFPTAIFFDEIGSLPEQNVNYGFTLPPSERKLFAARFFAALLIASQSKFLITHSGNCSVWEMLYRGNNENVFQWYKDKFI